MAGRAATETIAGYIYQFDYSIKCLLELQNDNDMIVVENIEDIDIHSCTEDSAIQCKYYAKTEYNHSVIAKPIRLMLKHYSSVKDDALPKINYKIYGFYKSGQDKLPLIVDVDFLKKHFLTYTEKNMMHKHHEDLGLNDGDLSDFLSLLTINIKAEEDSAQFKTIINLLKKQFDCDDFEAEHYYYNNALRLISHIAKKENVKERQLTKSNFITQIDKKEILFNNWFLQLKTEKKHYAAVKKQFFTIANISPYERFFLIELENDYVKSELKDLLLTISRKWKKISQREPSSFCPYVYIHNISEDDLLELKNELYQDNFKFIDGYNYKGASFCPISISQEANHANQISLKIIDTIDNLHATLSQIRKTKEIYQFYYTSSFFEPQNAMTKHVKIQHNKINSIKEII